MNRKGLSLLFLLAVSLTLGCGSDKKENQKQPNDNQPADKTASTEPAPQRTLTRVEQKLVGVWLGSAALEDKLVEAVFEAQADDAAKVAFVDQAESFLSTAMALHFKSDGTFEQDIEQAAAGIRQSGIGSWKVLEVQANEILVETVERDVDGNEVVAQRKFRLYPNGKAFAMQAPVSATLSKCNPRLVFTLQSQFADDRTAEAGNTEQR